MRTFHTHNTLVIDLPPKYYYASKQWEMFHGEVTVNQSTCVVRFWVVIDYDDNSEVVYQ
jgi:hypothetical protein